MTAAAAAPARKGPIAGQMTPSDLMRECGSKTGQWQPESPDQWRWQLKNADGPERALAWVKLNSIGRQSPYCVNAAGEELTVAHLAADCGWKLQSAKNFCSALSAEGRIRLQRGERIWYRADVPERTASEESKYSVQSIFPDYLIDFIESLPAEKKATLEEYKTWRRKFFADGMASLRRIDEQVQDTTLLSVGVKKKRLPKRAAFDPKCVQLALIEPPSFIEYSVQSNGAYKAENGFVQSTAAAPIIIGFNSSLAQDNKSVGRSVEGPTDRPVDSDDYAAKAAAVKTLLIDEYGRKFPDTPRPKLLGDILTALEGAPLELLRVRIQQRIQSATSIGQALNLAHDVGQIWREQAEKRNKAEAADKEREERYRINNALDFADLAENTLKDPTASTEDKQWAQDILTTAAKAKAAGGAA